MSRRPRGKDGAGYILDGAKSVVLHGDVADKLIVTARTAGARRDRDGIGLFLVDADTPGRVAPRLSARRTACAPPKSPSKARVDSGRLG